jgi:hypothetical protein
VVSPWWSPSKKGYTFEEISRKNNKKLDSEKQIESKVSRKSVTQWKSNRDRGQVSKENIFIINILKP